MKVAAQKLVLTKYFVITLEYFCKIKMPAIFNKKNRDTLEVKNSLLE